jgi:hypothetical protein
LKVVNFCIKIARLFQSTAVIKESISDNSSSKNASDRINGMMSSSDGNEEKKAKLLINFNEELQALIKPVVAVPLSLARGRDRRRRFTAQN